MRHYALRDDAFLLVSTGLIGLVAALFTGAGEFLLHFDPQARYGDGLQFFHAVDDSRASLGHFIGVLSAPLYIVGIFHLHLMLRSASPVWALIFFVMLAYSLIIAFVWLGSRASLDALADLSAGPATSNLLRLYELRYETLLDIARLGVTIASILFVVLILTGRSAYPRWVALLNPFLLIALCFVAWLTVPTVGLFIMPVALNVAFAILFAVSSAIAWARNPVDRV